MAAASVRYAASRTLTASAAAGIEGWDMTGMAVREVPVGTMRISAGIAVIIQIMPPAISA
jgi:hypothetical protein